MARGKKLDPYFAAIKGHVSCLRSLSDLMKCTELKLLTAALPNSLESLNLQLKGTKATEEGVTALQARVHLPRMRCLESDAFTSTHMPLVMKIALLEEFPARGRLFRSAAAKCAFLSSLSTYLSLFDPYRDHTPAKEHKNGVQVASFWYHIGDSRPRAHPRSYIILLYAS